MLAVGFSLFFLEKNGLIIGICIAILLTSFSDLQGSFRHRTLAMIISVGVNTLIIFVMNMSATSLWLLLPAIAVISFIMANLSVYGNRASMFSLSGLLAMVFSLIRVYSIEDIIPYLTSFIVGGALYIAISSLYHWLTRKRQTMERLGELAGLTAEYLSMRVSKSDLKRFERDEEILRLQTLVTTKQEEVRNLLLSDRQFGGQSRSRNRNMLLLIELIDMMELAVANPAKFQVVRETVVDEETYLAHFHHIGALIAERLLTYARFVLDRKPIEQSPDFDAILEDAKNDVATYVTNIGLPQAREGAVMLRNLHDYLEKQVGNLVSIERLLTTVSRQRQIDFSRKKHGRFLTREDYSPVILKENFTTKSSIFRHAVRLTIALLIGYSIGVLLHVENAYWILLTIVVIMRPGYGLTRQRSNKRLIGTIVGVVVAILLIQVSENPYYFVSIAAISMLFAFSLLQRNYLIAAAAITLNVVFVFSLIDSDHWDVITYRLVDTLIGAAVSVVVSYIVLPNWEYVNIRAALLEAFEKNGEYLRGIANYYRYPEREIEYRLLRKEAFLSASELNGAFQRYMKDPASKKQKFSAYYELVTLNQSMLSTLANLGSYIKTHHIADLTDEVDTLAQEIANELRSVGISLETGEGEELARKTQEQVKAEEQVNHQWDQLEELRNTELRLGKEGIDKGLRLNLQEVKLIQQEFAWLQAITESMSVAIQKLK